MPHLRLLLGREEIARRVGELARQLEADYEGRHPLLLGVLKGAFLFLGDLCRQMQLPAEIDFVQVGRYGRRGTAGGPVRLRLGPRADIRGRHVIIVEDIVDRGLTLQYLRDYLARRRPASLRTCALLVRGQALVPVDYQGFAIGEGWVVGYGLDLAEEHRCLPDIYLVEEEP